MKSFLLFEHALGYALLRVKAADVESISSLAKEYLDDREAFCKAFKLHAFVPFGSSASALENCNAISEGIVPVELQQFLLEKLPGETLLCISERKLADAIKSSDCQLGENISLACESDLNEVYRAIRLHFPNFIKDLSHFTESTAQIGLGHSYSRSKVKFNIYRNDNMIIQSINLLDQLDKDINVFCMRLKEWFSYHFPELIKIVPDNITYSKVIGLIGTRSGVTDDIMEQLADMTDPESARLVMLASKSSFGFDITEEDAEKLTSFTGRILQLAERRKQLQNYLSAKLTGTAPNLSTLVGDRVSARLISHAGSLVNLAKFPASTIQILGAEKALFRALRSRGKTPKYGLIYHSPFIGRASRENKGRISRFIAAKCAIASRLDYFSDYLSDIYGRHMKQQVEDRLTYYETGETPKTNQEAMLVANAEAYKYIEKMKKRAIKLLNKKNVLDSNLNSESTKKKHKKSANVSYEEISITENVSESVLPDSSQKRSKKKKRHNSEAHVVFETDELSNITADQLLLNDNTPGPCADASAEDSLKLKKKKKRHSSESATFDNEVTPIRKRTVSESSVVNVDANTEQPVKKKKKHTKT